MSTINNQLGQDQFLQLLVTQLRSQDPLDPIKDQEFIAQLAQLSTVDQIEQLNASFGDLLTLTQLTQGTNLIGRSVTYQQDGATQEGTVAGFNLVNGRVNLLADGNSVLLDDIISVT